MSTTLNFKFNSIQLLELQFTTLTCIVSLRLGKQYCSQYYEQQNMIVNLICYYNIIANKKIIRLLVMVWKSGHVPSICCHTWIATASQQLCVRVWVFPFYCLFNTIKIRCNSNHCATYPEIGRALCLCLKRRKSKLKSFFGHLEPTTECINKLCWMFKRMFLSCINCTCIS